MSQEDTRKTRIENLQKTQAARKEDTLSRVDQAIKRLERIGGKINFHTVAREAKVSVSYLYKYPELKQHIAQKRSKQSSMPRNPVAKSVSEESHVKVVSRLKERILQLDEQNRELRRKNEALAGQIYRVHYLQEQVSRQQQTIKDLADRLRDCESRFPAAPELPAENPKLASIDKKRSKHSDISDSIKSELTQLGIGLNSTLTKTIKSASEQLVLSAIEALKEAMANGNISRPGGWLSQAIKEGWMPSEKHLNKVERDIFNEWFNLAKNQGLIMASIQGDDGKLYVFTKDGIRLPFEQMLAEHPVEKLKASL